MLAVSIPPVPQAPSYTVFIFEQEPTDWLNESEFFKEKDEEFERKTKEAVNRYFEFSKNATPEDAEFLGSGLTVLPEEYLPDFEKEYWWKEHKITLSYSDAVSVKGIFIKQKG